MDTRDVDLRRYGLVMLAVSRDEELTERLLGIARIAKIDDVPLFVEAIEVCQHSQRDEILGVIAQTNHKISRPGSEDDSATRRRPIHVELTDFTAENAGKRSFNLHGKIIEQLVSRHLIQHCSWNPYIDCHQITSARVLRQNMDAFSAVAGRLVFGVGGAG